MSYYTDFYIMVSLVKGDNKEKIIEFCYELNKILEFNFFNMDRVKKEIREEGYECTCTEYNIKWYQCQNDITELGKKFPELEIIVESCGEEREDWWILKVIGNRSKMYRAVVISPEVEMIKDTYWD